MCEKEIKTKINSNVVHLGRYEHEEDAHQAYLDALKKYNLTNKYA